MVLLLSGSENVVTEDMEKAEVISSSFLRAKICLPFSITSLGLWERGIALNRENKYSRQLDLQDHGTKSSWELASAVADLSSLIFEKSQLAWLIPDDWPISHHCQDRQEGQSGELTACLATQESLRELWNKSSWKLFSSTLKTVVNMDVLGW